MLLAMVDLFLSYCDVYHLVPTCAMVQCDHVCRDTDSGFNCSCLDGYYLDDDNRSCIGMYNYTQMDILNIVELCVI